ncbi:hypothetical protein P153DRAFT_398374 [Dothidotthia symphoricarpi CBS 119687]|uniref:Uncharacterized protein n=1 Tax=Dothidotthia symphoricarpi CBS 119687 TaxID=1392245 RepID=A0A6A6A9E9_9PLEO|nr:uncharacterized protein P153DRAFT_398374 [Dothidotthia symphoricarpi CBS 119687]KAF2127805.1 hypothetical protein P153DRAFT_398374 [Dothidotthia symphoricarpi CBS 119687]
MSHKNENPAEAAEIATEVATEVTAGVTTEDAAEVAAEVAAEATTAVQYDEWQVKILADMAGLVLQDVVFKPVETRNDTVGCPFLPNEIIGEIGRHVTNAADFGNLRLVNQRFNGALNTAFVKNFGNGRVIYPRYDSFKNFFAFLANVNVTSHYVEHIVLVAEGLKENVYGYDWAWEDLVNFGDIEVNSEDIAYTNAANHAHFNAVMANDPFLHSGGYRSLLGLLLTRLPNLRTIKVRKMTPGEHSPGWKGPYLLKQLSFYTPTLNTNPIYYGDWQYDTVHRRVTVHKDEFGDDIAEPNAGPQASCVNDIEAAITATGHGARVVFLPSV